MRTRVLIYCFMSHRSADASSTLSHTQGHCFATCRALYNRGLARPSHDDPAREHFERVVVGLVPERVRWRCNWCERFLADAAADAAADHVYHARPFDLACARRHLAACPELDAFDRPAASFFQREIASLAFASSTALPASGARGSYFLDRHVHNNLHGASEHDRQGDYALREGIPRRSGRVHIAPGTAAGQCVETSDILFQREEERKLREEVRKEVERRRAENQARADARRNKWRDAAKQAGMLSKKKKREEEY